MFEVNNKDISEFSSRCPGSPGRGGPQGAILPPHPRTAEALHPERALDSREPSVRLSDAVPLEETAQGPHQGQRGGGSSGWSSHDSGERHWGEPGADER